ncbi:MAG TPA: patatin-like phospholipase family protein, partial [Candidatus Dormibacteraeota bacterium]|nr:patatin-like phospholipase family protein [Candidatus Dormibacteraeota bacterium]
MTATATTSRVDRRRDERAPGRDSPLGALLDVFQLRSYFNAVLLARDVAAGGSADVQFLRALVRSVSGGAPQAPPPRPFPGRVVPPSGRRRIALVATGGSGAMASLLGALRACEEAGVRPSVISMASGAALFGMPVAAGRTAAEVARFTLSLRPADYIDWDWRRMARSAASGGRGFGGFLAGRRLEEAYLRFLGDRTLADLAVPAYVPVWNVEESRLEYLGPRTHPDLTVAHAVHMAVAMPLLFDPVSFAGGDWCDGGIVDILPVRPALELEPPSDAALVVNCFYPPGFAGEPARGWRGRPLSILGLAEQVRSAQHLELARENLERLAANMPVAEIQPVDHRIVQGL